MRTLAIDFGERRIGLAISDARGRVAVPMDAIHRTSDRQALEELAALVAEESVERLVVGEPRRLDGSRGDAAERVGRFADKLAQATGLPIEMIDESLTSVEAAARMAPRRKRRARDGRLDSIAAQILLQESLDLRDGSD